MNQNKETKRRIPNWLVSFLILLSVCVVSNFLSVLFQRGAFNFWRPLPSLSSPVTQIVNADPFGVWVKTNDNHIFAAGVTCTDDEECYKWAVVKDIAEIHPLQAINTKREVNCEDFDGLFPRNPSGKVIECVQTYQPGMPEGGGFSTYYALMSDGTVKYWRVFEGAFFTPILCLVIPTFICPPIGLLIVRGLFAGYSKVKEKAD
jgi:hypothetical protein